MAMTAGEALEPALGVGATPISRTRARRGLRTLRGNPLGTLGLALLLVIAVAAVAAPIIAPHSPQNSHFILLQKPGGAHPFGTDRIGRDILCLLYTSPSPRDS